MNNKTIVVIGAGPAGLSAALWLKNLGFTPVVIEKEMTTGGMQNFNFLDNDWVLGQVDATGLDIAKNFDEHIKKENIDLRTNTEIIRVGYSSDSDDISFDVTLNSGKKIISSAFIVATGTRYRGKEVLPVLCDEINPSFFVEGPHAFVDIEQLKNQHVAIVGAGDNAFENALLLLEQGCKVTVIARSSLKAQARFLEKVLHHSQFTLLENAVISAIYESDESNKSGKGWVVDVQGNQKYSLTVDRLHILAGYQSNIDSLCKIFLSGLGESLACDENGFLCVDSACRTNIAHVYAAGDSCDTQFPSVVSAVAGGALAAKTISRDL